MKDKDGPSAILRTEGSAVARLTTDGQQKTYVQNRTEDLTTGDKEGKSLLRNVPGRFGRHFRNPPHGSFSRRKINGAVSKKAFGQQAARKS